MESHHASMNISTAAPRGTYTKSCFRSGPRRWQSAHVVILMTYLAAWQDDGGALSHSTSSLQRGEWVNG